MNDFLEPYDAGIESLFFQGDGLTLELDPALESALSQNSILNDLFYQSVAEGDLERAGRWGGYAMEAADLEACSASTCVDDPVNYDPEGRSDIYHTADAMEHWEFQGDTSRCAQMAQLFVIEELTGRELDADAFCAFAEQNGWFDGDQAGTSLDDLNKMLDYFDIDNEMSQGKTFKDLLNCLENGSRVIVAVDSGEYWYNEGFWEDFLNPNGADHAIEVIGFDAEKNSVIVNDSGTPNGRGLEIPLDTFLDAWKDSDNLMIECFGK